MIRAILALIILCICAGLGYLITTFPAFVIIETPDYIGSTSLIAWLIISLISAWLLLIVLKIIMLIWRSPTLLSRNAAQRKQRKAHQYLGQGMAELIAGHYAKAEKLLVRGGDIAEEINESPVIYFENAALAADHQGAYSRRDSHLLKARQTAGTQHTFTARLHEAELHIEHGDYDKAVAILEALAQAEPKNLKILKLLDAGYAGKKDWQHAWETLKKLRNSYSSEQYAHKQKTYAQGLLNDTPAIESEHELAQSWRALPKTLQAEEDMQLLYAGILAENGHHDAAATFLANALAQKADINLIQAYSQIRNVDARAQLRTLNRYATPFKDHPIFLLAKAKIAYRAKDYATAQQAVEASLKQQHSAAAFILWAQILEADGQPEAALAAYREGTAEHDTPASGELLPPNTPIATLAPQPTQNGSA